MTEAPATNAAAYALPAELLAALVAFLAECPYGRVFQLVEALRALEPIGAAPTGAGGNREPQDLR